MNDQSDSQNLAKVNNLSIASQIKEILKEKDIYCIIESDNPASSVMHAYTGLDMNENITIKVGNDVYKKAKNILQNSSFHQYIL